MKTYHPMFDLETYCIVRDLVRDSKGGDAYLEIRPYLQRYALNTTLTLCYGIRMVSGYLRPISRYCQRSHHMADISKGQRLGRHAEGDS